MLGYIKGYEDATGMVTHIPNHFAPMIIFLLLPQVFERHEDILEHIILVSIEGYVRDWEWNGVNSISTPYFGAVHWHRGKRQQDPSLEDIIASKTTFALLSAKIRHYDGKSQLHRHKLESVLSVCTAMLCAECTHTERSRGAISCS